MSKKANEFNLELLFSALADNTRLRLLNLMETDEVCVCFFVEILQTNQPKISRHLAYLRRAGIVEARREGLWMHYRIIEPPDEGAARILREVRDYLSKAPEMLKDRNRMVNVCCAATLPASVQGAPIPTSLANKQCSTIC